MELADDSGALPRNSFSGRLIFNRTVGLRDTWAKIEKGGE